MTRLVHVTTTDISLELLLGPQLRAFQEAGYEVHTASAPGPFVESLEADGIVHHPLDHATRSMAPHKDALALRELYRLFRKLQPGIVHTHNPKPGVYGRLAAAAARVPVVVNTVHGLYATPQDPFAKRAVVYGLERIAATFSDAELLQNPEDIPTLAKLGIRAPKVQLLGNGVDLERFSRRFESAATRRRLRAEIGADDDEIVVGAVGRLVWEKGYRELFDAAAELRQTHPKARFVVIGPADPAKADGVTDADIAAAEASGGITFLGHRSDVEDWYLAMDLYVLASYREGFPRSAMEAAAMELPVIATDIRGCRQVVDHDVNGLLVPVRDAGALVTAIGELVDDDSRRDRMAIAALAKAHADFDDRNVIDITLATYERLLQG